MGEYSIRYVSTDTYRMNIGKEERGRREQKIDEYNIKPNVNNHSPAQKLNTYKYQSHTSTIHSDKTCGVRYLGG